MLQITPSERLALEWLATGESASEMADRLGLTERELDDLLVALFVRMGVETRREAVAAAIKRGLVDFVSRVSSFTVSCAQLRALSLHDG